MTRSIRFIFFIIVIVGIQLITGCRGCSRSGIRHRTGIPSEEKNGPESNSGVEFKSDADQKKNAKLSLNKLFEKYRSAVFMVYTSDGEREFQGSGFFITSDGIAISNYHVFEGTSIGLEVIKTANGQELKVEEVIAKCKENDYIIFKVGLNGNVRFTPIPVASKKPEIGEDVFAIGSPYGLENTLSKGIVSGYRASNNVIQTTVEITHGSSGGPLLNMMGEVIGIATAGMGEANLNFAVNIQILNLKSYLTQAAILFEPGKSYMVSVTRVIDGDTFVIHTDDRVRLIGVDTPETVHPQRGIEPFGPEASEFTTNLVDGKQVKLEFDITVYDRNERLLAYVYIDDIFLNEALLLAGLAQVSTYPPNVKYVDLFLESQRKARNQGIGIWTQINLN